MYFDLISKLLGHRIKERIEQIHEVIWEKMFIAAICNHENVIKQTQSSIIGLITN